MKGNSMLQFEKFIIITGHYGSGKTSFALNLVKYLTRLGRKVKLIDLDIVNPYFRSSDYSGLLDELGAALIASDYNGSTLDIPALSPAVHSVFGGGDETVIFDVGGDDTGAVALGRYSELIKKRDYQMLYIVNHFRALTQNVDETVELMYNIEHTSQLKVTEIVNNSHLKEYTSADDILSSVSYAEEIAAKTGLPLLLTTAPVKLEGDLEGKLENMFPIEAFVKTVWE